MIALRKTPVYFTDLHTDDGNSLIDKAEKLAVAAGIDNITMKDRLVAIKIHFGEPGNLSFLRHNYAARIARMVSARGGIPFVTDANTLYKGSRADAVHHLLAAAENGYSLTTVGCPVVIADGLKGYDHREIPINLKHFDKAYIASGIADADVVISLNHFKGHVETGFGGAIKNVGMGSGSREGKFRMHCGATPEVNREKCVGCGACAAHCAYEAALLDETNKAYIREERCVGCGQCVASCNFGALRISWDQGGQDLGERIAEYALATLQSKEHLHMNFIVDVSPLCDCVDHNDVAIVPNIGILASRDPVALDVASADLTTQAPGNPGSAVGEHLAGSDGTGLDKFMALYPESNWRESMAYAEKIGLGSASYELVRTGF